MLFECFFVGVVETINDMSFICRKLSKGMYQYFSVNVWVVGDRGAVGFGKSDWRADVWEFGS